MNLYDFDNTIYDGESSVDFFMFVFSKKKYLIKYLPLVGQTLLMYKAKILSLNKVQEVASECSQVLMRHCEEADMLVREFWQKYSYKLKTFFLDSINNNDIIITACPNVLISGIQSKLNTKKIICSEINIQSGQLEFLCMGENKIKALYQKYPGIKVDSFYTDSFNDMPLMMVANKNYLVKGNQIFEFNIKKKVLKK